MLKRNFFWTSLCFYLFLCVCVLSFLHSVFWPPPSAGISQFYTAVNVCGMCVCCIYSLGHHALQSCEWGYRSRGGNRWLQAPSPFLCPPRLSVSFPPSFLPWSICPLERQEGLLFWRWFPWPDPSGRVLRRPGWKHHRQFLFSSEGPVAPGITVVCLCVQLVLVKAPGSSQNSQTHTHNLVPTGRKSYWICRCSGGQWESLRKFDKSFLYILSYRRYSFGIF